MCHHSSKSTFFQRVNAAMRVGASFFLFSAGAYFIIASFKALAVLRLLPEGAVVQTSTAVSGELILALIAGLSTFAGLLAYIFHTIIKKEMQDRVDRFLQTFQDRHSTEIRASIFIITAYILAEIYVISSQITYAERAIEIANKAAQLMPNNDELVLKALNNIAFTYFLIVTNGNRNPIVNGYSNRHITKLKDALQDLELHIQKMKQNGTYIKIKAVHDAEIAKTLRKIHQQLTFCQQRNP